MYGRIMVPHPQPLFMSLKAGGVALPAPAS